jgi:hypothetical protein
VSVKNNRKIRVGDEEPEKARADISGLREAVQITKLCWSRTALDKYLRQKHLTNSRTAYCRGCRLRHSAIALVQLHRERRIRLSLPGLELRQSPALSQGRRSGSIPSRCYKAMSVKRPEEARSRRSKGKFAACFPRGPSIHQTATSDLLYDRISQLSFNRIQQGLWAVFLCNDLSDAD